MWVLSKEKQPPKGKPLLIAWSPSPFYTDNRSQVYESAVILMEDGTWNHWVGGDKGDWPVGMELEIIDYEQPTHWMMFPLAPPGPLPQWRSDDPDRDWPEDFEHENGNYMCSCGTCKETFMGHKRRITCKKCVLKHRLSK